MGNYKKKDITFLKFQKQNIFISRMFQAIKCEIEVKKYKGDE